MRQLLVLKHREIFYSILKITNIFGGVCMSKERYKLVTLAGLFLRKDDKILLQKRCNNEYCSQLYAVPGGSVEAGESVLKTIVREAEEELGIKLLEKDLKVTHVMHLNSSHGEFVHFFVETNRWDGEPKIMEPSKCSEIKWFSLDTLPENITKANKQAIELSSKGVFFSEQGW